MTRETASEVEASKPKFDPRKFLVEVRGELDKVVWPGRQQLISQSLSVVLIVFVIATFIYLLDGLLKWIAGFVF